MKPVFFCCLVMALIVFSCTNTSKVARSNSNAIPVLKVSNGAGTDSLQISKLLVDVQVTGNVAVTTFDITFANPVNRVLEGEFEFPLADGQNISRYALEINGALREGVVVEKEKARVAFENTIRQKVDPGLVEKTKGNNFRTRIYPIPANGEKRVLIGIEEQLAFEDNKLVYRLPLYAAKLKQFSLRSLVQNSRAKPVLLTEELKGFDFSRDRDNWQASFAATDFSLHHTIDFTIPLNDASGSVFTGDYNGNTAFYITTPMITEQQKKTAPNTVALLWDISASATSRNREKEIALLEQYAAKVNNQHVTLVPFNIVAQQPESFDIQNGNVTALIKRLRSFDFDGGTQLGALNLQQYAADEMLLFTDGLSTFGKAEVILPTVPVTVISSSAAVDYAYCKFIATETNGQFIDLNKLSPEEGAGKLAQQCFQFINASYNSNEIDEVYPATISNGGFSIAGIMKTATATIQLNYGYGNTVTRSQSFTIHKQGDGYANIKKIWAAMKIAQLDLQYAKNKATITALGKTFSIVTQNTSLIVLDRVEDYVEYEITPPADLQETYVALLKEKKAAEKDDTTTAFTEALQAFDNMKAWWGTNYKSTITNKHALLVTAQDPEGSAATTASTGNLVLADSMLQTNGLTSSFAATTAGSSVSYYLEADAPEPGNAAALKAEQPGEKVTVRPPQPTASIQVTDWKPDAPYLKQLDKVSADKYLATYVFLKKEYRQQPSFYADVARFLFAKKSNALALQVLSNIAEMKLEDAELLRIVANQLLEMGERELAVETFKDVLEIRGEQPQSYRDLALACSEAGNYTEAVNLLYKVVTGKWDNRFGEIKCIALNEMNAIIAANPAVDLAGIDKRLVKAMPVDVRIVIAWSSDNSDVDLWVTDPKNEKCMYSNTQTSTGGRISNDVTQGYGPEEYLVKKAPDGKYLVEINFFGDRRQTLGGPVTVKAELFTHFGQPNQKREIINCRLTGNKEVIKIGSLTMKG